MIVELRKVMLFRSRALAFLPMLTCAGLMQAQHKPNIVIIFTDDQGYQDLGCYGSPLIQTPAIDGMAREGLKLTDFYVSASVSSASRAGLLTGRLNTRNGVKGVFFPESEGMPSEEITLAEALKEQGYATGCFGKWHLGDLKGHLPTDQGFDKYFGIPYSNDMYIGPSQKFASNAVFRDGYTLSEAKADQDFVRNAPNRATIKKRLNSVSPLFEGDEIIEYPCDQSTTTRRYFDKAIEFVGQNKEKPFFVYITPSMPHIPLFASEQFRGKSKRGLYGDVVEEIDWNVGRFLNYLDQQGLAESTLVIFASDNGPWLGYKEDSGSADPLRGGKFSYYEGGVRVPCILRWKGTIPAGVTSDAIIASIDLFPTIMHYAGCRLFRQKIDGVDISSFLENPSLRLRDEYVYVKGGEVHGIRKGDWVYLPKTGNSKFKEGDVPELFNLKRDIGETNNLHLEYPEKVKELQEVMQLYQASKVKK
jgi:arylsulfatase A